MMESHVEKKLKGLALSRGCAFGQVCMFNEDRHSNLPVYHVRSDGVNSEVERVEKAVEIVGIQLDELKERVQRKIGRAEAEIFVAQKMILQDPEMLKNIVAYINNEKANAEVAVSAVFSSYEDRIMALDNEYIKARATDLGEIKRRVLDEMGNMRPSLECNKGHCTKGQNRVVVANELTPSLTVDIHTELTIGFITEHGGVNSHAAILARALGIPAVSGLQGIRDRVGCGTEILVNGDKGEVIIWPSHETVSSLIAAQPKVKGVPEPVDPVEGLRVMANINLSTDIEEGLKVKAEGIGLYRTEFEIMAAERFFSENELYDRYLDVASAMAGNMVIFRLFDVGSDKTAPFMKIPREENPSLGWRGTRLLLGRKDIFETQARALARVSAGGRVHVMYPMIVDLDQFREIKSRFMESIQDIDVGIIKHGIMFEVPSACLQAEELYREIDFGSIGTNDLTQYLFAVDRDNEKVSYDYNHDRPVFWSLLKKISDAAVAAGKPLSICGELAGFPENIPKLLDLGINSISVSSRRISDVRRAARDHLK